VSEALTLPIEDAPVPSVTAALHRPATATGAPVLLTHGAGGDLDNAGLVALAEVLAGHGHPVVRANLPYREAGRRGTPRAEANVGHLRRILEAAAEATGYPGRWIAGGKSYGGRVASLLAAEDGGADRLLALLFYGYPLHPPGKPERLRVEHWPRVPVPCLFLQGSRDTFGDPALLEQHARKLPRRATIHVVEGGDHSLKVTAAASPTGTPSSAAATIRSLDDVIGGWLRSLE
jgi:predicted alpha/beta-hydrolase family hydrolase